MDRGLFIALPFPWHPSESGLFKQRFSVAADLVQHFEERDESQKITHELAESLRNNVSVGWAVRDSVRAKLRLLVKRILR